jgi:hypothetical protein
MEVAVSAAATWAPGADAGVRLASWLQHFDHFRHFHHRRFVSNAFFFGFPGWWDYDYGTDRRK